MSSPETLLQRFRLPPHIIKQLDDLAGNSRIKSRIVEEALTSFLERKGSSEIEIRFAKRLDWMSKQLERIERNTLIEVESLALFVRYMLTVHAPLPEGDEASRALGKDRFDAFVSRVARQLETGRTTFPPAKKQ